jgi:hypothetical protein
MQPREKTASEYSPKFTKNSRSQDSKRDDLKRRWNWEDRQDHYFWFLNVSYIYACALGCVVINALLATRYA